MLSLIYALIIWVIVPIVILAIFALALRIVTTVTDSDHKTSARAGFWAGLLLFVVYVVSQLSTLGNFNFTWNYVPQFQWVIGIAGVCAGFVFLAGIRFVIPTRIIGLVTLLLVWASSSALFSYIFIANIRDIVIGFALGTIIGALIYIVLFPAPFREIWQ